MKLFKIYISLSIILKLIACNMPQKEADTIIHNATIYTCDSLFSIAEAMVIKQGMLLDVGSNKDILSKYHAKELIDAHKQAIFPGFYDAHCHFVGYAYYKKQYVDLSSAQSIEDVIALLKNGEQTNNSWILGNGWDQNKWTSKSFPTKDILDIHFPDKPVYLSRIDGHAAWVNSKALSIASIDVNTKIQGGDILIKDGSISGILIDNAMLPVLKLIPPLSIETKKTALTETQHLFFANGLTSIADAGLSFSDIQIIDALHKKNQLNLRIYAMLDPSEDNLPTFVIGKKPYITDKLSVRAIKLYADGALGSRGACLLTPYNDFPNNHGLILFSEKYLQNIAQIAYDNHFQLCVHAIGDSANRLVLNTFKSILKESNDRRWRIEHAQLIHPDDFVLFKKYNIIPSIQTTHAIGDMLWAEERLGKDRMPYAYAYKTLLEQNDWLANGTDFPVEDINPIMTFFTAVFKKNKEGSPVNGFYTQESINRKEALLSITYWPAKAAFEENIKGSLEIGKWADFVILNNDLMTASEKEIPFIKVLETFIAGKKVFSSSNTF